MKQSSHQTQRKNDDDLDNVNDDDVGEAEVDAFTVELLLDDEQEDDDVPDDADDSEEREENNDHRQQSITVNTENYFIVQL